MFSKPMLVCQLPETWDYVDIHPFGDLHIGAKNCAMDLIRKHIDMLAKDKRARIFLMGDIINNGVKSSVTNVYEEALTPGEQKRQAQEMLEPLRDKIIGIVAGNHENRTYRDVDQDVMWDIAHHLDLEEVYCKDKGIIYISLGRKAKNGKNQVYVGKFTHGAGGGMYIGSGANRQERYIAATEGVDFVMSGHTHKPFYAPISREVADSTRKKVFQRLSMIMTGTAWLYHGGYADEKMLSPVPIAPNKLRLYGHDKIMEGIG